MKKRLFASLLTLLIVLGVSSAAGQTLPGLDCFSPGLVKLHERLQDQPALSMTAEVTVDQALYARDLSVLAAMLDGTTICYEGDGDAQTGSDYLRILRQGATLFDSALTHSLDVAALRVNDAVFLIRSPQEANALLAWDGSLWGTPILERVPLADIASWLESLQEGDKLWGGLTVVQPFSLERTMSDDGTRLTKIRLTGGSIAHADEAPWTITGFLRQPAGRAPKDTFELVLTQDERNTLELSYSALRENTITRKNAAGTMSVRTALKAAGLLQGNRISSRLSVSMKNAWQADEDQLSEKLTLTATLSHQDNTPGRRMQRLNAIDGTLKNVIRITTSEASDEPLCLTDDVSLEIVMDENTFAAGSAALTMTVGGESHVVPVLANAAAEGAELSEAVLHAVQELAAGLYRQLDEGAQEKIQKGLPN